LYQFYSKKYICFSYRVFIILVDGELPFLVEIENATGWGTIYAIAILTTNETTKPQHLDVGIMFRSSS